LILLHPVAIADVAPRAMRPMSGTILVTGATGRQGGAVARELLRRGYAVRGLTRNPESAAARALASLGATVIRGDFGNPDSLDAALTGADGVFAVTNFWEHGYDGEVLHGRNLVDAAVRAETPFFVFSSVASADRATNIPHFESKWAIEKYLRQSGLDHAVLRPVSFMENWSLDSEDVREGEIVTAGDPGKLHQYISVQDIARFVADAIAAPEKWNRVALDIAADEISLADICAILTELTGRPVAPVRITWSEYESLAGAEMAVMSRWFSTVGYGVRVDALRAEQPGMVTMTDYLWRLSR
jgi:uncharacterized protein YbjT (DUF2867 family)